MSLPIRSSVTDQCTAAFVRDGWRLGERRMDGALYRHLARHRSLSVSTAIEDDGHPWLHLSLASQDGSLPTWEELREIKDIVVGESRYAYQVLPPRAQHINIHPNCLHLFASLDGAPDGRALPDFTRGGSSL